MKKIRSILRRMKIKSQIHYSMLLITVLSSLILGIVAYQVSKFIIERNYNEAYTYNLEVASSIVDIQLEKIIDAVRNSLLDTQMMSVLKRTSGADDGRLFSSADDITVTRSLVELAGSYDAIEGISLISADGNQKFYYKRVKSGVFEAYYDELNVLRSDWVEETFAAKGKECFYANDVLLGSAYDYFSMTKALFEPFSGEFVGYMVISIRDKVFEKAFGDGIDRYVSVSSMVVDRLGINDVVYGNWDNEDDGDTIIAGYLTDLNDNPEFLFSTYKNKTTGWEMVNIIHKSELEKDSTIIGKIIFISVLMLIMLSTYISVIISNQINRPLNKLEMLIEKVGEGDRNITEVFDESEIGLIGNKFKGMVNNNLELSERLLNSELHEREAELLLLQSQINPHFLYNTLDSLYCMAVIEENDKIANMVEALSNIFKLSLNKGETYIKVSDELLHIEEYMKIHNYRFNNRFTFEMDIEEKVRNGFMIKLILQPIVENAVIHGLEKKVGTGKVSLKGNLVEGDRIRFIIEDDGVGFDDTSKTRSGYGIRNVRERIRLCYGNDYGIVIKSIKDSGTIVTVEIPFDQKPRR